MFRRLFVWLFGFAVDAPAVNPYQSPQPLTGYKPRPERFIFRYHDGRQERVIDPAIAWDRYRANGLDLAEHAAASDAWLQAIERGDDQKRIAILETAAIESQTKLAELAGEMFDVKPLDEGGLTREERGDLLAAYFDFIAELKKKRGPLPTLTPPSPTASSGEPSPTPSNSESNSMPSASSDAERSTPGRRSISL